ncbi:FecR family protein [Arachidicoccus sp.]|jgi:ferric-dicitrate binding protein FerR (iron transport regulator)|uniref:FecR family protein n=1 Tax=Arachidicoccus sp. TaxID=1872624 RepID=UPI003D1CBDF8
MDNNITPEMIERFLNNQSDEAEAERVAAFLNNASQDILNRYLPDDEWQDEPVSRHMPDGLPEEMWQSVEKVSLFKNYRVIYLKRLLVAACSLGVLFIGYYIYSSKNDVTASSSKQQVVAASIKTIVNRTNAALNTVLPDGSKLVLEPRASVHYSSSFKSKRDIYLSGTAFFSVTHDSAHPFVVRTNGIATTDLGTEFWVVNGEAEHTITVKLIEGSVMVSSFEKSFGMDNVYLKPGQKVVINKVTGTAYVSENEIKKTVTKPLAMPEKRVATGSAVWTNAAYTFSKSSLEDVFKKLEMRYNVIINVKPTDISGCQFTGKIMYSDSLETLIQAICDMNNLKYSRQGNTIDIKK